MNSGLFLAFVTCAFSVLGSNNAQHVPPRLQIPGAIPIGAFPVPETHFRNERVLPAAPGGLNRVRRPQQKSAPPAVLAQLNYPQQAAAAFTVDDAKPVIEDGDDEYQQPSFIPPNFQQSHLVQLQQQPQQQQQAQQEQHHTETVVRLPQQQQAQPQQPPQQQSDNINIGGGRFAFAAERQAAQQHAAAAAAPQQSNNPPQVRRPTYRDAAPAQQPQQLQQQPIRRAQQSHQPTQYQSQHDPQRPRNSQEAQQQQVHERDAKPVAQILRKYREENEDGSITWGFENDDGSYKEEFIGIDCITRGRYGYVDPDGMKREYTYETGNACDPNKKSTEEDEIADGYIDYQNQEMVLSNGDRIDLSHIGKNKGRKPTGSVYRN